MNWLYTVLASPVLVAAVPLAKRIFEWWVGDRAGKALVSAKSIYAAMNEAQYRLNSDRILIISAHNCGGPLRPDVLLYVDALYEVVADLEPRLDRIANVRIDSYLIELLSRVVKEGMFWINTKDIPQGSYVRNLYETDGVSQACTFLIRIEDKQVIYGVIHFKKSHISFPKEADAVATLRAKLALHLK